MKRILSILLLSGVNLVSALDIDSQQIRLNGHFVHYYQAGNDGTPLILLTGYATTSNFWNSDFVQCLAKQHRVYLLDYAGMYSHESANLSMQSMALDVNKFSQQLKLKQPALIGWSMGGGVALEASFLAPKEYRQLYLLAPVVPVAKNQQLTFPTPAHGEFRSESDVLNYVFSNNLYAYESKDLMPLRAKFIVDSMSELFPSTAFMKEQRGAIEQWKNSPDTLNKFKMAKTPAVFFIPDHDKMINQQVAESVISQYPNAKTKVIEKSGHAIPWQLPLEMCQQID